MNFNEFIEEIKTIVKEFLGKDVKIEVKTVLKNNGVKLTGLVIMEGENNCAPNIYLNHYYSQYQQGRYMRDIAYEISEYYEKNRIRTSLDISCFMDFEKISDQICFRLINREKNRELLEEIPYIPYLDLAIIFYGVIKEESIGNGSILIKNEHLKKWNVTAKMLWDKAFKNTPKLYPGTIIPMEEMIISMLHERIRKDMEKCVQKQLNTSVKVTDKMVEPIVKEALGDISKDVTELEMYVLSNREKYFGASSLLYENILKEFADHMKSDYYILPSSVHEVILVPVKDREDEKEQLANMVREVNCTELDTEDILSDGVYLFERSTGLVSRLQYFATKIILTGHSYANVLS